MTVTISRSFKDISLSFAKHPVTNDLVILKNEDAIKKSVINLVRTRLNERFFNDLLGTSVDNTLFEVGDSDTFSFLEEEITTLLNNFEPRINLKSVLLEFIEDLNNLNIKISYDIVGLPFPIQNIEFILQPTRV
jgi:phage baseplate assembly protein W